MAAPLPVSLHGHDKVHSSIKALAIAFGGILDCLYIFFHIILHIFHTAECCKVVRMPSLGHRKQQRDTWFFPYGRQLFPPPLFIAIYF